MSTDDNPDNPQNLLVQSPTADISLKFHQNLLTTFGVMLQTNRQTNKHLQKHNFLGRGN